MPDHPANVIPPLLVDALNAAASDGTFSLPFEAKWSFANWSELLSDLNILHVDVVPVNNWELPLLNHSLIDNELAFDIVIRKRFEQHQSDQGGRIAIEEIAKLVQLTTEIAEFFVADRLAEYSDAIARDPKMLASYVSEHLRTNRQYTGHVRLPFQVPTPIPSRV
jgi:hypothetical protein